MIMIFIAHPSFFLARDDRPCVDLQSCPQRLNKLMVPLARDQSQSPLVALRPQNVLLKRLSPFIHAVHIGDTAPRINDGSDIAAVW
jgi:hypothetical protein